MKKILKFIVLFIFIISLTGCSEEKTYSKKGISITMPRGFRTKIHETATVYYENDEVFVIALKENFSTLEEIDINASSTISEYADMVLANTEFEVNLQTINDLTYFTYEYEGNDATYYYVSTLHKGPDAFWVCNFVCESSNKDKYLPLFIKWAKTITFE